MAPDVIQRSRRNVFSTNVSIMSSGRNAALCQPQPANMSVSMIVLELYRPNRLGIAAAHFGGEKFKALVQVDAGAMLFAGDWIADRLRVRAHDAVDLDLGFPFVHVGFEYDRRENRIVQFF